MNNPILDELDVLDTIISSIAILSNPDWAEKRKTPQDALDEIHDLTSIVIGDVMKRISERAPLPTPPALEERRG